MPVVLTFLLLFGTASSAAAEQPQIVSISGTASVEPAGGEVHSAETGELLEAGDIVRISTGGSVLVSFDPGGNAVVQAGAGEIEIPEEPSRVKLARGILLAKVKKPSAGGFEVRTPTCIAAVRGTEFSVTYLTENSDIAVFDSEVEVENLDEQGKPKGEKRRVAAGKKMMVRRGGSFGAFRNVSRSEYNRRERFLRAAEKVDFPRVRERAKPREQIMRVRQQKLEKQNRRIGPKQPDKPDNANRPKPPARPKPRPKRESR